MDVPVRSPVNILQCFLYSFIHMLDILGDFKKKFLHYSVVIIVLFAGENGSTEGENNETNPNAGRFVRYQFTPQFLKLKLVGAT